MKPNIGLTDEQVAGICKLLNTLLADEFSLYARTRNSHWNVTGPAFSILHKFFEAQYDEIDEIMDEVAERVRMLGQLAEGNINKFAAATRLGAPKEEPGAMKMVQALLTDHETIIRALRNDINTVSDDYKDAGTADFMTGLMKAHEKMAWMLRAHLS